MMLCLRLLRCHVSIIKFDLCHKVSEDMMLIQLVYYFMTTENRSIVIDHLARLAFRVKLSGRQNKNGNPCPSKQIEISGLLR